MAVIEVTGLTKRFKEVEAVKGVDLTVYEGEVFGFLGPNGAGKTTTISMLCTILKPDGGQGQVAGYDLWLEKDKVRQNIGLVFQDPTLDRNLTAYENLWFHALIYGIPARERRERIEMVLKMVELYERKDSLVQTFSGGMKRRLEIARGLLHHPKILFLDEPTVGLDPQTRVHIWEYIHKIRKEKGITIFLTTHYMDEAENCDRIAVIDQGKIIALDTPDNLKQMVGNNIVYINSPEAAGIVTFIKEKFNLEAKIVKNQVVVEVKEAETFIPALLRELPFPVTAVSIKKPTLDDVFLKLTGREIRDEVGENHRTPGFSRRRRWR
ncbi:daunorubicin resistance protein DrrA family ABC transporter ATP-binding protein [Carboxydothermus ferrireducens]|uniref:ABC-2 type transport system ATP-binding protein n=1 Tax=Carboxydothermus ferrireducens DSM 11255 TaxID=1119529 RepID=A0ABX2R6L1_9THEO|nr:daunorubicin resistance protein DrrA family ABC transporter ATP-binding protein [Carboxydothermus ferrireducens]NYE56804.1 ABC-2 type transport system ATP-binding protein [Carboxydothermus ferrireducens DSM 11255]